jgi:hypothetical protein
VIKRAFLQLICIFALLVAQQAALTHWIWHLGDVRHAHEQQGDASAAPHSHDRGESPQSTLCEQHGALAALLSGNCLAQPPVWSTGGAHWLVAATAAWRVAQRTATPPSRAPPVLP